MTSANNPVCVWFSSCAHSLLPCCDFSSVCGDYSYPFGAYVQNTLHSLHSFPQHSGNNVKLQLVYTVDSNQDIVTHKLEIDWFLTTIQLWLKLSSSVKWLFWCSWSISNRWVWLTFRCGWLNGGELSGPDISGNPRHCHTHTHTGRNKVRRKTQQTCMAGLLAGTVDSWTWGKELPCLDFSVGVDFPDLLAPQDLPISLQVFGTFCFPSGLFIVPICLLDS